ncbi:MAG: hypothetical protein MUO31_05110, partial [Thermodesulfovibrionales bacterium]|nr:hypothetical protein [Thermodesulfovibrionales bacterium]
MKISYPHYASFYPDKAHLHHEHFHGDQWYNQKTRLSKNGLKGYFQVKQDQLNKDILSGDDAIGRGAIEAGISLATSYPGTPATEILEYIARNFTGDVEWAVNEKVAFETAIGASYAG